LLLSVTGARLLSRSSWTWLIQLKTVVNVELSVSICKIQSAVCQPPASFAYVAALDHPHSECAGQDRFEIWTAGDGVKRSKSTRSDHDADKLFNLYSQMRYRRMRSEGQGRLKSVIIRA
jgi:hypothetical protein